MNRRRLLDLAPAALAAVAADWPRFRGPNGAGTATADLPDSWSPTKNVLWKTRLPGTGYSSPVVAGGEIFVQTATADGGKRGLVCLDAAAGGVKWDKPIGGKPGKIHKKNSLASGTPVVDGGRVYVVVWDGSGVAVHAFTTAGEPAWNQSLGGYKSQHGPGHSPVVVGGKVVVNYDQDDAAEIVAFDAATGERKWAADRKAFRACYSTPVVRDLPGGKVEIVVSSTAGLAGYDPDTGKENWAWAWAFDGMALRTVGSPIIAGEYVVAISGDGGGSRHAVCVKPGKPASLVWEKKKGTPYVPCPVVSGDFLYWVNDDGVAACVETKTGVEKWSERATGKGVTASPVLVGNKIIAFAEDGKSVTFLATPAGYEKLATGDVGETVYASPAVSNDRLFIRGAGHLFCVGKK